MDCNAFVSVVPLWWLARNIMSFLFHWQPGLPSLYLFAALYAVEVALCLCQAGVLLSLSLSLTCGKVESISSLTSQWMDCNAFVSVVPLWWLARNIISFLFHWQPGLPSLYLFALLYAVEVALCLCLCQAGVLLSLSHVGFTIRDLNTWTLTVLNVDRCDIYWILLCVLNANEYLWYKFQLFHFFLIEFCKWRVRFVFNFNIKY